MVWTNLPHKVTQHKSRANKMVDADKMIPTKKFITGWHENFEKAVKKKLWNSLEIVEMEDSGMGLEKHHIVKFGSLWTQMKSVIQGQLKELMITEVTNNYTQLPISNAEQSTEKSILTVQATV